MIRAVGGVGGVPGVGVVSDGGDPVAVGDATDVGLAAGVGVGLTSGEFVAWFWVGVQLDKSNIKPATAIAGAPPLFIKP